MIKIIIVIAVIFAAIALFYFFSAELSRISDDIEEERRDTNFDD